MDVLMNKWMKIIYLLFFMLLMINDLYAESVSQCFSLNKLPNTTTKSVWIEDAKLKEHELHKKLSKNLSNPLFYSLRDNNPSVLFQDLSEGKGTVFAFRELFPGRPDLSDTSNIQYMSIYIPKKIEQNIEIDLSKDKDVLVIFTKGSPSFRNVCYGYAKEGKIQILKSHGEQHGPDSMDSEPISEDSIMMNIDVKANTKYSNRVWAGNCGSCVFQGNFVFSKSPLKDMLKEQP